MNEHHRAKRIDRRTVAQRRAAVSRREARRDMADALRYPVRVTLAGAR